MVLIKYISIVLKIIKKVLNLNLDYNFCDHKYAVSWGWRNHPELVCIFMKEYLYDKF